MQVLVIGGGTMGAGIAQVMAGAGHRVRLVEVSDAAAEAARARLASAAERATARAAGSPDPATVADAAGAAAAIASIEVVSGMQDASAPPGAAIDLAVEAVFEDEALKHRLLAEIEDYVPKAAVIASNTSSLSITALASALEHPERFLGMHFFNPVPRSALVELVTGPRTSEATVASARRWVRALGKEEIVVRDSPGFATSRLGVAAGLEAIRMLEEGVASAEDIDRGMVIGYRHPMGPLRLTDLVGLDVRLAIADYLARTLGPRFEPPQLLRQKVAAGEVGKKAGKGFFDWGTAEPPPGA
jgi:3-hydroxybutyryl-CoA dehydrogenase